MTTEHLVQGYIHGLERDVHVLSGALLVVPPGDGEILQEDPVVSDALAGFTDD